MEYRQLSQLVKLEDNPRTITQKEMGVLKQSITDNPDYFEARPLILSDRTGELVIIGGNQRFEAALALGLDKVPTYLLKDLTQEREQEIIVRDNVNNGEWNWDELANWGDDLTIWGVNLPIFDEQEETKGAPAEDLRDSMSIMLTFDSESFVEFMTVATRLKEQLNADTITDTIVKIVKEQYESSIR